MSLPETLLWVRIRRSGLHFRRQHPVGDYILDFYCAAAKLAVEVDGAAHDFGKRPLRDERRMAWLNMQGIELLRVAASDVLNDPDAIADSLMRLCRDRVNPSTTQLR